MTTLADWVQTLDASAPAEALPPIDLVGRRASYWADPADGSSLLVLEDETWASGFQIGLPPATSRDVRPGEATTERSTTPAWTETVTISIDAPSVRLAWSLPEPGGPFTLSCIAHGDSAKPDAHRLRLAKGDKVVEISVQAEEQPADPTWKVVPLGSQRWAIRLELAAASSLAMTFQVLQPESTTDSGAPVNWELEPRKWRKLIQRSDALCPTLAEPASASFLWTQSRVPLLLEKTSGQAGILGALCHGVHSTAKTQFDLLMEDPTWDPVERISTLLALIKWTGTGESLLRHRVSFEHLLAQWADPATLPWALATLGEAAAGFVNEWPPAPPARGRRLPVAGQNEPATPVTPPAVSKPPDEPSLARQLYASLGLDPDAPFGRFTLAPKLSGFSGSLRIENVRVGQAGIGVRIDVDDTQGEIVLEQTDGPLPMTAVLAPEGDGVIEHVHIDGNVADVDLDQNGGRWRIPVQLPLDRPRSLRFTRAGRSS